MDRYPLVDELAVVDSGSVDKTREVASKYGADVYLTENCLTKYGTYKGKGENLWKALYLLKGDIIIYIDADIKNIHPKFVYGLVGPLLKDDKLGFVKAFYERPLVLGNTVREAGGGRVTEILIRPLFNLFFPELAGIIQPLSGEYAARRKVLESIPFFIGYGVETGLLIDIYEKFGIEVIAQVDLDRRVHKNQRLSALGKMSFGILQTFLHRANNLEKIELKGDLNHIMKIFKSRGNSYIFDTIQIEEIERPPMITIEQYQRKFKR